MDLGSHLGSIDIHIEVPRLDYKSRVGIEWGSHLNVSVLEYKRARHMDEMLLEQQIIRYCLQSGCSCDEILDSFQINFFQFWILCNEEVQ